MNSHTEISTVLFNKISPDGFLHRQHTDGHARKQKQIFLNILFVTYFFPPFEPPFEPPPFELLFEPPPFEPPDVLGGLFPLPPPDLFPVVLGAFFNPLDFFAMIRTLILAYSCFWPFFSLFRPFILFF